MKPAAGVKFLSGKTIFRYLDAIAVARFKKVLVNFMFKYQKLLIYARFDVFLSQILLLHSLVMHLGNCPRETT